VDPTISFADVHAQFRTVAGVAIHVPAVDISYPLKGWPQNFSAKERDKFQRAADQYGAILAADKPLRRDKLTFRFMPNATWKIGFGQSSELNLASLINKARQALEKGTAALNRPQ
jgi:hypothetical protein